MTIQEKLRNLAYVLEMQQINAYDTPTKAADRIDELTRERDEARAAIAAMTKLNISKEYDENSIHERSPPGVDDD